MATRRATKAGPVIEAAHAEQEKHVKRLPRQRGAARHAATAVIEPARAGEASGRNGHAELDKVELLRALLAFRRGDFSVRLAPNLSGLDGKIADAFNDVLEISHRMAAEFERINQAVGTE